uniref:Ig-like domain-containing protein n=1 Tax=Strigamia maritima TaxID=126957 RepID=T1J5H7_STRMM
MVIQPPKPSRQQQAAAPPTFEKLDRNARLVEGGNAVFELVIKGIPSPTVVWTRKNGVIRDSNKFQVKYDVASGVASLLIKNLQREDEGEYTCTATNQYGEAICTVFIQAQDVVVQQRRLQETVRVHKQKKYEITSQRQDTELSKSYAHFEKSYEELISGKDGEPPSPPTFYTNGTDETFRVDTFEYRLLREIEFRESKTRRLIYETSETETDGEVTDESGPVCAPQILQRPRNSKLLEGTDATFQAKITGNPKPRITWFKNGVRIFSSQRYEITYKNQIATLRIRNALPEDAGYYTLLAENKIGRVVCSAQLIIESVTTKDEYSRFTRLQTTDQLDGVHHRPMTPTQIVYATSPAPGPDTIDLTPTKSLKPAFVKIATDKEVTEGKMVRFDCRISGRPYPEVLWYLNNKLILNDQNHKLIVNEAGNHSLMITLTNQNDAGTYTCIARNRGGEASFQVKLTVIEREQVISPKFVERFQTMHVREGEPVTLHCRAVGAPTPRIAWQKDGVQIHSTTDCRIDIDGGTSSLTIYRSRTSDSAWYQCTAQNSAGSTATRARLFIETEPVVQTEPWRLSLPRPTRVIRPAGSPEREIIWLRHVQRARPRQQPEEEDTRIRSAPMFTHLLKDIKDLTEGERVHFEARLVPIGDPTMKIEWYFNGRPLVIGSRIMTHYHFGYVTMDIINATSDDAGQYTCHAVNELGEDSTQATLTVSARSKLEFSSQYPQSLEKIQALEDWEKYHRHVSVEETVIQKPVFIKELRNLTNVRENHIAHFEAQVTPMSDPTMKIEWHFNGRPLQASSRITTIYNFGYVAINIMHIRYEDEGTYTCTAKNKAGSATTKATLTVQLPAGGVTTDTGLYEQRQYIEKTEELEAYQRTTYKSVEEEYIETAPKFITEIKHQMNVPEGQVAHFEARLEPLGDPHLKVVWLKDGKPLEASSRITTFFNFGYVSLTIKDVKIQDIGTYTCKATNRKGTATSVAKLTILTSKGIVFETQHPDGLEKIQHLEDTSRYTRRVMEETMIKQIPRFTTPLRGPGQVPEGERAHLETRLEPLNDPTMRVEWFLNGRPILTGHRFQTYFDFGYVALDILYVHPEDTGVFTVRATNNAGTATQTSELIVNLKTPIDTRTIHKVGMEKIQRMEESHFVEPSYVIDEVSKSKPYFPVPLKDPPPLKEGEHIHLECRLEPTGDPTLQVEWFFNGRPLTVGTRFKTIFDFGYVALDITFAYPEDTGEYTVRATNHLGTAHTSSSVRVIGKKSIDYESQYPDSIEKIHQLEDTSRYRKTTYEETVIRQMPSFVKPLKNLDSSEGSNIHLEARLQPVGDPTMKVEWFFNGQPVKTGHRFRPAYDFDYVALDVLSIYAEDSGLYSCKATNCVGEAVTSASVKITAKKSLILESQHPEGLEQIQYLEDTSRYHREVWTEEEIRVPPRFLTKFKDLQLREGQNAHFECRLEPLTDPNLKVEWFRNEKSLTVGHRFRPLHDFGYVALDILGVVPEDTGVYKCRATNLVGSDEMSVKLICKGVREIQTETQHEESLHQIQYLEDTTRYHREEIKEEVSNQPPVFTTSIRDIELKEGQRSHFECRLIPVNDPNMKVEWFRNNVLVKSGTRFTETNNFGFVALDILTTYPEDSGTYTCKATNPLGSATTSAALKCHAKRSIILETQHEEALEQIQYLEDPGRLMKPARIEDTRTQAPMFTTPMKDLVLMENRSAHFETRLIPTADPNLKVEWYKNGVPLQAANRVTTLHDFGYVALDLSYVKPEDSGTYTCKASNDMGTAVISASLVVQSKSSLIFETQNPEGLEKIQKLEESTKYHRTEIKETVIKKQPFFLTPLTGPTQRMEAQSTHMECRVEPFPDPNLKIEWFFNGKPLTIGHRFRTVFDFGFVALDILTVYPEDSGVYTVKATNLIGSATSSLELTVTGKRSLDLETQHPQGLEKIHLLEDESKFRRPEYQEPIVREKPQFVRPLRNLENLIEGRSAHLEASLTPVNDPTMKVEWFFNGTPVPQGHRFKTTYDFGYVALDILYVYPEDAGTYMCKATNCVGEAVTTCRIDVQAKKSIDTGTLHEEGLKKIHALETVYRPPREEIPFAPRPPEFLIPLVNQNLKEGQGLHLDTRLEPINDPDLKVEWFVNGVSIQTGHRFRTTHDFGYVAFDILYAYPEDVGLERIRELEAPKWQRPAEPEPPQRPPIFTSQLMGTTLLTEGDTAHLEARVEPVHDPHLTVEFFHNGTPLEAGSRFHITFDFGYVAMDISHVFPEDTGNYTAVAKNQVGQDTTSIEIEIQAKRSIITDTQHPEMVDKIDQLEDFDTKWAHPSPSEKVKTFQRPVFTVPLKNLDNLTEDEPAHLECRLIPVGDPTMKVEWFHNDRLIPESSRYKKVHDFDYVALDMGYVRPNDVGVYMCRATNANGEAVTTCSMKIRSKASIIYDTVHPQGLQKIRKLEDVKGAPPPEQRDLVYGKPVFTAALTGPTELWEGQAAHYECRVIPVGDPSLHFEWYINGIELRPSARQRTLQDFGMVTLDIGHVIPEDAGVYMCKAMNDMGEAITSIALKVHALKGIRSETFSEEALRQTAKFEYDNTFIPEVIPEPKQRPPIWTTHLESHDNLVENQSVHLQGTVEPIDDEKLRIEWYKNGLPLQFGTRMRNRVDFGLVTLDISGIRSDDSGIYTCRAVNEVGEAITTCTLKATDKHWLIGHPQHPESLEPIRKLEEIRYETPEEYEPTYGSPVFLTHLNNVECWEADHAHFHCQVEPHKDPSLVIEFFYNGQPLPLATKFTVANDLGHISLDISHSYPEDAGVYMCRATNQHGQAITSGSLKVHSKKSIIYDTQHPKGLKGLETVQAVEDAFTSKAGYEPLDVEVEFPKPVWVVPLQPEFTVNEGQGLHLEGRVEPSADPKLTVEWFLNGKPLEMGSRFSFIHDFGQVVLDISDLWPRDCGIYTSRARNDMGEAFTTTTISVIGKSGLLEGTLHPKGKEGLERIQNLEESLAHVEFPLLEEEGQPPVFTSQFENLTNLTEGDIAHFEASLTPAGDQTMVVEWFFNDQPLHIGHRLRTVHAFGMVVLEILGVYMEDSGVYTCRATNKWGQAEISVNLECIERIKGQPPRFTTQLQDLINLKEGDSGHFECNLIPVGDPAMKVEWFHNGKPMRDSSRIKTLSDFGYVVMDISFVEPGDNGEYVCRASNKYGEDFTRCRVECLGRGTLFFDSLQPQSLDRIAVLEGAKYSIDSYAQSAPNQPPKYTTHIQSLEKLVEGHSAHFEATLIPVTDPDLVVEWYFNGEKLKHGHRFRTFHDFGIVILDILYCYAEDSGVYEAVATNKFGQDITRANLKCRSKASLIFDPQIPKEMEGGLEKIQYLEEAMYRTRKEMIMEPGRQPPVFTVPLENQTDLREGENAHLEARLTPVDDPKLKVEWFKNGVPLRIGSRFRAIHDFGFVVLEMSPVYPEDAGEYHCRASNELGEAVTSCTVKCEGKRGIILETQLPHGMETGVDKIAQLEGYSDQRIPEVWVDQEEANPPQFITQPEDLTLPENSFAHFECQLIPVGDPSMRVEWFHNGKPVTAGSRIKTLHDFGYVILEIAGAYPRDSGQYTCKATNKHGEATTSCRLTVQTKHGIVIEPQLPNEFKTGTESLQRLEKSMYQREEPMQLDEIPHPPHFTTQIQDLPNLMEGDPAHFECRVEPIGVKLEWFHNGKPLDPGTRLRTMDDFGFVVLDVDWTHPRDCGEYLCRASNQWGEDTTKAVLMCKGKRDIIMDSQLPEGIDGEKLRALELPHQLTEIPAAEEPLQPPKFVTQIKDQENIYEGDLAHFDARLVPVNDPKLEVQWYHNNEPLQSGHRFKTTHDFDYVALDILYAYPEDSGEYLAHAHNDLGEDTTKATLKCKSTQSIVLYNQVPKDMNKPETLVQMEAALRQCEQPIKLTEQDIFDPTKGSPPKFITQIQDLDLKEMEGGKFECQLSPVADPNMKLEWFFNGRPLAFTFIKVAPGPGIDYSTQLPREWENALRKIQDIEAGRKKRGRDDHTRQREPPTFLVKLEPFIVDEGEWAKFRVRVTGNPKPRLTWFINGKRVVSGSRYKLSYDGMHRLDIPKARQYDHGKVEVFAKNSLGEASCATTLDVRPKRDDYRALLKRSPRPWYDTKVKLYQEDRKDLEVERKFEEHLSQEKSNLYHVDEDTRKHLCTRLDKDESYLAEVWKKRRLDAQGIYVQPEEDLSDEERQQRLKESISLSQHMAKTYEENLEDSRGDEVPYVKKSKYRTRESEGKSFYTQPAESSVHGKEIHTQKQTQTQKEQKGDQEIHRKKTLTEKFEQEHKGTTTERRVLGKPIESIPPVFTKKIQPYRAFEGEPAKFECEFTGTPAPSIIWYRENYPIKNSTEFCIMTTDTSSTLVIREVFMEDSGDFSVLAQNRVGTAKSNSNLVVDDPKDKPKGAVPPNFLVTAQDVNVKVGQLIRLDTKVNGSKPMDVYWLKNGKKVQPDIRYKMLEEDDVYTLLIIEAFPEDIGNYECVALSKYGEARCQAQVYVDPSHADVASKRTKTPADKEKKDKNLKAPTIIMPLSDQTVNEGQSAVFRCRISATPAPQVKWLRGDNQIKPSRYFRMSHEGDQYTLRISESFPEDEGNYKCVAQNSAGQITVEAKLRVLAPESSVSPPTVAPFKDIKVKEGQAVKFTTQVSGTPTPAVQWFREGILIPHSQDFQMLQSGNTCSLTITSTYPEDTGRFCCRATNPSGQAEATAFLRVERTQKPVLTSKPEPVEKPTLQDVRPQPQRPIFEQNVTDKTVKEGEKVTMDCVVTGQPKPKVKWFFNSRELKPSPDFDMKYDDNKATLTIREIFIEDAGEYICRATNIYGTVISRCIMTVEELTDTEIEELYRTEKKFLIQKHEKIEPKMIRKIRRKKVQEEDLEETIKSEKTVKFAMKKQVEMKFKPEQPTIGSEEPEKPEKPKRTGFLLPVKKPEKPPSPEFSVEQTRKTWKKPVEEITVVTEQQLQKFTDDEKKRAQFTVMQTLRGMMGRERPQFTDITEEERRQISTLQMTITSRQDTRDVERAREVVTKELETRLMPEEPIVREIEFVGTEEEKKWMQLELLRRKRRSTMELIKTRRDEKSVLEYELIHHMRHEKTTMELEFIQQRYLEIITEEIELVRRLESLEKVTKEIELAPIVHEIEFPEQQRDEVSTIDIDLKRRARETITKVIEIEKPEITTAELKIGHQPEEKEDHETTITEMVLRRRQQVEMTMTPERPKLGPVEEVTRETKMTGLQMELRREPHVSKKEIEETIQRIKPKRKDEVTERTTTVVRREVKPKDEKEIKQQTVVTTQKIEFRKKPEEEKEKEESKKIITQRTLEFGKKPEEVEEEEEEWKRVTTQRMVELRKVEVGTQEMMAFGEHRTLEMRPFETELASAKKRLDVQESFEISEVPVDQFPVEIVHEKIMKKRALPKVTTRESFMVSEIAPEQTAPTFVAGEAPGQVKAQKKMLPQESFMVSEISPEQTAPTFLSDEVPGQVKAKKKLLPQESLEVSEVSAEMYSEEFQSGELPGQVKAKKKLLPQESLEVSEVSAEMYSEEFQSGELPGKVRAKKKIQVQKSLEISEIETGQTHTEFKTEELPGKEKAKKHVIPQESVEISEVKSEVTTESYKPSEVPGKVRAKKIITTQESVETTEIETGQTHSELYIQGMPTQEKAKKLVIPQESVEVSEVTYEMPHGDFKPGEAPGGAKAKKKIITQESLEVSEIETAVAYGQLYLEETPSKVRAKKKVIPQESIEISQVETEVTPGEFYKEETLQARAKSKLITQESLETSEVTTGVAHGEFHAGEAPGKAIAKRRLYPQESVEVSEVTEISSTEKFVRAKTDKAKAKKKLLPQESLEIVQVTSEITPEHFQPGEIPGKVKAKRKVTTQESLEVSEVTTEVTPGHFQPGEIPGQEIAGISMDVQESVKIEEVSIEAKTRELSPEEIPWTRAKKSVSEQHSVSVAQITPEITADEFKAGHVHGEVTASSRVHQMRESVTISEISTQGKTKEFYAGEIPGQVQASMSFSPRQSISIAEITPESEHGTFNAGEVPGKTKAYVRLPTQQLVTIEETATQHKEGIFQAGEIPGQKIAKKEISTLESITVQEVRTEQTSTTFMAGEIPGQMIAEMGIGTRESLLIGQVTTAEKHGTFLAGELPGQVSARAMIMTKESLAVSEVHPQVEPGEFRAGEIPGQIIAKQTIPTQEHMTVQEVVSEVTSREFLAGEIPGQVTAKLQIPMRDSVTVAQITPELQSGVFKAGEVPGQVHAKFTVSTRESIVVSETTSEDKPKEFLAGQVPGQVTARVRLSPQKPMTTEEVTLESSAGRFERGEVPGQVQAKRRLSTQDSLTTSEIVSSQKSEEFMAGEVPGQVTAKPRFSPEKTLIVEEISSSIHADEFKAGELPGQIQTKWKLSTQESMIVSEVKSEDRPGEFRAGEVPGQVKAKSSVSTKEFLTISETTLQSQTEDLGPMPTPVKRTAELALMPTEPISISQVTAEDLPGEFKAGEVPGQVHAKFTVSTRESLLVSETTPEDKPKEFLAGQVPGQVTAKIRLSPQRTMTTEEVTPESSAGRFERGEVPGQVQAKRKLSTMDSLTTCETISSHKSVDFSAGQVPGQVTAAPRLSPEKSLTIEEISASIHAGEFKAGELPCQIQTKWKLSTQDSMIVSEVKSEDRPGEFKAGEVPGQVTAKVRLSPQRTMTTEEVTPELLAGKFERGEVPGQVHAKRRFSTRDSVTTCQVVSSQKSEEFLAGQVPGQVTAAQRLSPEKSLTVQEISASIHAGEFKAGELPGQLQTTWKMLTQESMIVSEVKPEDRPGEFKAGEVPGQVTAKSIMSTKESLAVSETTSSTHTEELGPISTPLKRTAEVGVNLTESIAVAEVTAEIKPGEFKLGEVPGQVHARFSVPTRDSVQVLEVIPEGKPKEFIAGEIPGQTTARVRISPQKTMFVEEVVAESSAEKFEKGQIPGQIQAKRKLSTVESVTTSETISSQKPVEFAAGEIPGQVTAAPRLSPEKSLTVQEISTSIHAGEFKAGEIPGQVTAKWQLSTRESMVVSEVKSEDLPGEFKAGEVPGQVKAKTFISTKNSLSISETQTSARTEELGPIPVPVKRTAGVEMVSTESISIAEVAAEMTPGEFKAGEVPGQVKAKFSVPTRESLQVSVVTSEDKPKDFLPGEVPGQVTARITLSPQKTMTVEEITSEDAIGKFEKGHIPGEVQASRKLSTVTSLTTSEIVATQRPGEFAAGELPGQVKGSTRISPEKSITVEEVVSSIHPGEFKPGELPGQIQAKWKLSTQESMIVSEVKPEDRPGEFKPGEVPGQVTAKPGLLTKESFKVSETLSHTRTEDFASEPFPKQRSAELGLVPVESIVVSETKSEVKPGEFKAGEVPGQITARVKISTRESVSIAEVTPELKPGKFQPADLPGQITANFSITSQEGMSVSEVTSEVLPKEFLPGEVPGQVTAQVKLSAQKSLTVQEITTEDATEHFKPGQVPGQIQAKRKMSGIESITVAEVITSQKTSEFIAEERPKGTSANLRMSPQKTLVVEEVQSEIVPGQFAPGQLPGEIKAKWKLSTQESMMVSEVSSEVKPEEFKAGELPGKTTAQRRVSTHDSFVVFEARTHTEAEELGPTVLPKETKADFDVVSSLSVAVSEVMSEQKPGEFVPGQSPFEVKAKSQVMSREHVAITEVRTQQTAEDFQPREVPGSKKAVVGYGDAKRTAQIQVVQTGIGLGEVTKEKIHEQVAREVVLEALAYAQAYGTEVQTK